MDLNTGLIDLNSEDALLDRENEVVGVKSTVSNVVSGVVSRSETLGGDPSSGSEVVVHDQKVCHVGDDSGVNGLVDMHAIMNHGVMINGSGGKEGFGEEHELVGVEVGDMVCNEKAGEFSCEVVKNEDGNSGIEYSDRVLFSCEGTEHDRGLVFDFNEGFHSGLECENVGDVTGNGLLSIEVLASNMAQGGDNDKAACGHEVKNDALVNSSAVVEGDDERNASDRLVVKDGINDLLNADVAAYQQQDDMSCMEVVDVTAKESLHVEDLSRICLELEPSQVCAQVDVMQNHTMIVDISEGRMLPNIQNECHGFNLVVDLNSYRKMQEVGVYHGPAHSEWNFCAFDLVWAKVRGHPWWPGQIFDASDASEKAKRHLKEHCYLVAYFGDQSFAWNDVSMIKPFQMHFSQMEKQSNLENFRFAVDCALDEVSRRVQFSLSCPCIPQNVFSKLKTQVISNAGVNNQLSGRNVGGDRFMNVTSFEPLKLINFVKSLAESPLDESDRLDFVASSAQLLAFNRYKGHSQLPEFTLIGGLYENDMETLFMRGQEHFDYQTYVGYSQQEHNHISGVSKRPRGRPRKLTHVGFSQQKHNHISGGSKQRGRPRKHKLLSDLMYEKSLCVSNGEHTSKQKSKPGSECHGRKRMTPDNTADDYFYNSQNRRLTLLQRASTNEMRSQLCLASVNPNGVSSSSDMVHFFAEFRNSISLDYSASLDLGMYSENMQDCETEVTSAATWTSMTSAMEPCNDSYWTDRIIQSIPEEQSLTKYHNERAIILPETLIQANPHTFSRDLGFKHQDTNENLGSESTKIVEHLDGSSKEDICPTALTLKFSNLDCVPSTTDLNKIFGRFGPLLESKTELLEKSNRARVVFQRRCDAETAFSSAGKYSIFGPSLVSYRLKILPRKPPKGTGKRGRKRKETSSVDGVLI
ncbi:hypothetical protein Fmac_027671 [Flemingia macrophylla]|uniref:PWWP domain-containing protein n=1 Tax=Flemingia macrophylla TaxID=520843 RepID=A0ABD1LID3_9FABA